MLPKTLDNAVVFGYNGGEYNFFDKGQSPLECRYARCSREPARFDEECVRTAELLAAQAEELHRTPVLMLSGGLDSEVVVKSFIDAGLDFEISTFKFEEGLNDFEIYYVERFCKRHALTPMYEVMDIKKWATTEEASNAFNDSAGEFFEMVPHMYLMQKIWDRGGMPILGNGDVYMERLDGQWYFVEFEYILAWYRFAITREILGGIAFFQHTPEQALSMLREPVIERLGLDQNKLANAMFKNSRYLKYDVYKKYWPDLESRRKFNGGEKLHAFYHRLAEPLRRGYNGMWTQPYSEYRANLEPV